MMGQREIDMKLLIALAVGLMLAGPVSVSAQDYNRGVNAYLAGDYATALKAFRPLAKQGYANAQNKLGDMYDFGDGVREDEDEAVKWYRLAAEQGYANAQSNLGFMYFGGRGVREDYALAHMWFSIAIANGYARSSLHRDTVEKRMTREQIAEAQTLARRCMASNYQDCGWN